MIKRYINRLFLLILIGIPVSSFADNAIKLESLSGKDGALYLCYHVKDLMNEENIQAINRGISSQVVHHIQLWKKKSFISIIEKEVYYSVKIFYDNWGQKYKVVTEDEERLTPHIDKVIEKCSTVNDLPIIDLNKLDKSSMYFISINIEFQPISAESYNAISDLISGKDSPPEQKKKDKGGIYSIMLNILGFGDKSYSFKTDDFTISSSGEIMR